MQILKSRRDDELRRPAAPPDAGLDQLLTRFETLRSDVDKAVRKTKQDASLSWQCPISARETHVGGAVAYIRRKQGSRGPVASILPSLQPPEPEHHFRRKLGTTQRYGQ